MRWTLIAFLGLVCCIALCSAKLQQNPFEKKSSRAPAGKFKVPPPMPGTPQQGPNMMRRMQESNCTFAEVHEANSEFLSASLRDLVRTTFFKYYKVDLNAECPYWVMNKMCQSGGGCTICACDPNEVPLPWRVGLTDRAVFKPLPKDFKTWDDVDANMWTQTETDFADPEATYVNLIDNPESNTGYSGDEPRRIWDAIYRENCFKVFSHSTLEEMCFEERVFYRLISGLHTSITAHVFAHWQRDPTTKEWVGNQGLWNLVLGKFPERLDNLYFTLSFLMRALHVLKPMLESYDYDAGNVDEGSRTLVLIKNVLSHNLYPRSPQICSRMFDESQLFAEAKKKKLVFTDKNTPPPSAITETMPILDSIENAENLKMQLKNMFRNISVVMNCVGCEKCKMWGKLNILGIGTALKVLIADEGDERTDIIKGIQRNEIVALMNTVNSFSESVAFVDKFMLLDLTSQAAVDPGDGRTPDTPNAEEIVPADVQKVAKKDEL